MSSAQHVFAGLTHVVHSSYSDEHQRPGRAATQTHQMPSQAMTMKSWSSLSVRTLTSGMAEIICSSGGRALFLL